MACITTNIAASVGATTWLCLEYVFSRRLSVVGWCSGAIAGLVAISPASGFVPLWSGFAIGLVASALCYFAMGLTDRTDWFDPMGIYVLHAVSGSWGTLLTYTPSSLWLTL